MGEDYISEPPYYTIGKFIMPKTYPKPLNIRLDGWARYDPDGKDPNNPLSSNKASKYWKRHDPNCLMPSNPHRQCLSPIESSFSLALIEPEKCLTRSKRVRTLIEKGHQWAEKGRQTRNASQVLDKSMIVPAKKRKIHDKAGLM